MEAILAIRQNNCLLSGKHLSIEAIPIYKKFPLKCQFLLQRRHHLNYNCFFQKLCSCYMSSFPFSTFLRPAETSAESMKRDKLGRQGDSGGQEEPRREIMKGTGLEDKAAAAKSSPEGKS